MQIELVSTKYPYTMNIGRFFANLFRGLTSVIAKTNYNLFPMSWYSSKGKVSVTGDRAQGVPAYFRGINIIAEQMATLPVAVYRKEGKAIFEATTNPVNKLIKYRPHPLYDTVVFRETLIRNTLQYGESCFKIIFGQSGFPVQFELMPLPIDIVQDDLTLDYFYVFAGYEAPIPSKEIIHIKLYSKDGLRGQSPLKLLRETFASAINQNEYITAFYGNGAHVSGVVEVGEWLDEKQKLNLKEALNQQYSGPENVGKTMILQGQMKYKEKGVTPDKAQYFETKTLTTQDIANITGVHPILLGDVNKSTFHNTETVNRFFVQYVLRTFCKRFESEFNSKVFTGRNQGKMFLRFNLDGLLEGNTKDWAEKTNVLMQHGIVSRNEIREMENLNPLPGGDEIFVPLNFQPLNQSFDEEE